MLLANVLLWTALVAVAGMSAMPADSGQQDTIRAAGSQPGVPWPATDALASDLPLAAEAGAPRPDRFVGIFYFLWHDHQAAANPAGGGPYDVAKILAQDPHALDKLNSPLWGPVGTYHYWGEPLYGYYRSDDPWVIRRHAQLLADAGVDTLIFDTTNAASYPETVRKICEVFAQVRKEGGHTPQIAFMVNTEAGKTAQKIYEELYRPGLFRDLWFQWQGKPLLLCDPALATPEVRSFFTLRTAHWPFTMVNTPFAWHWEATYPQPYGYTGDPAKPEQVNVSVAQNLRASDGQVTNMSNGDARGRSFHNGKADTSAGAVNHGYNFQEQWGRAFEMGAPFVMVTGWNEWIAGRWGNPDGRPQFVDQYDEEFSRDIEPMRGGHGDNYYWQLVANIRRYKGVPALPKASPPKTISIANGFNPWRDVTPEFQDHVSETSPRDHEGAAGLHYRNDTGRNDITLCKVARDDKNVYFYVRTREPMTPHTDKNWMWLLIRTQDHPSKNWEGYDYIVNRSIDGDGGTWLEKSTGGWNWQHAVKLTYHVSGNELHIAIPRSALGLHGGNAPLRIDFKWADNVQHPGDIQDFYVSGDAAPEGRFRYRYVVE